MFTIIGGDGREYGPVTADQVRAWITAGRANLDTKAKPVGSEEWRRLGDYPDFAPAPAGAAAVEPESFSAAQPATASAPFGMPDLPTAAPHSELAGRGERLLAALIDQVVSTTLCLPGIIMISLACLRAGTSFLTILMANDLPKLAEVSGIGPCVSVLSVGVFIYVSIQTWMLVTRGQTIGKRAMEIRIVTIEEEALPIFAKICFLRAVVPAMLNAVPLLGIFFRLTDYFFIFREDRRCIHDIIAGTKVIKA